MWPFHPTGTRQIFDALFKATRTASPRAARLSRRAVRDKKLVEAEAERLLGPGWRESAQEESACAGEPTPSSTTSSPTSPQQSSPPTSLTTADLAATSSKFPTARPLQLRPTLAGNARPQEERSVHAPPLAAARSSAPASRRPNGPQAHAARVWRLDTGRGPPRPAAPAPSSALAPAEPSKERRDKILHDRKKGLYVRRPRSPSPDRARARASQHLEVSKPVKESQLFSLAIDRASTKADPLAVSPSLRPSPPPVNLPLDLERALLASHPSSLSSVRLTDPIPRAHFARAFAAEREAKLAEQVLDMHPRGASSVDLGTAPTTSASAAPRFDMSKASDPAPVDAKTRSSKPPPSLLEQLEQQLFSSFPRGARRVDLGAPPAAATTTSTWTPRVPLRSVQDVGLKPSAPRTDPFEGLKARTARDGIEPPQVGGKGVRDVEQLFAETAGVEEERARAFSEAVDAQVPSPAATSPLVAANPPSLDRPLAKPPSPLVQPDTPLSVFAMRDMRSRDPREADYPVVLRKILPASPLDRRIRLAAVRAFEDVERIRSLAQLERDVASQPALDLARWLAEIREYRARLRRTRRLEDRCLDGEMARNEEQRVGRQLEALVVARAELDRVVEAYRAYGERGVVSYQVERGLVDRLVRAQGLLEHALVLPGEPTPAVSSSTTSKAILWTGDRPFFVEWDAYIRTYRYGASRPLEDLEVIRRRELRKLEGIVARAHMSAFEERRARA